MRRGLLLINLGTPNSAEVTAVRSYLREFLTDRRVIDLPALTRYILVYLFILPFRSKKSAHAYQTIWTEKGSPLLCHSKNLVTELEKSNSANYKIALGMRYGSPSIKTALDELSDCDSITLLPLYPQYSSAATGSSINAVMDILSVKEVIPSLQVIRDFYNHPAYIDAQAKIIAASIDNSTHLLLSYHGIPERQVLKSGCKTVCAEACPATSVHCYRAQCYETTRLLAKQLGLKAGQYSTAFQSRLGKTPWIKPYTDEILIELANKGIKKLAVSCPSFVADCLETLEEIGLRAKEQWSELGGEEFILIPCMNSDPIWVNAIWSIIEQPVR